MRLAIVAFLCLCTASQAVGGVRTIRMTDPRPFGLFVGDVIERHAEIATDPGDELLDASVPHLGPMTYWLDLVAIDVGASEKDGARHYRVDLKYQTFYVPLESKRMTIPPLTLRFKTAAGAAAATIPAFNFTMSPLRELFPEKTEDGTAIVLRPNIEPRLIKTGSVRTAMAVSAATALLALVLIAYHNAWGLFRRRPHRPFTEAARRIRLAAGENGAGAGYRKGLIALHRAFDEFAGHRLLAEDLDRFLATHPNLDQENAEITRFFASSRSVFFADDLSAAIATLPPSGLLSLAGRLASFERGAA
jgi:mxaA protein